MKPPKDESKRCATFRVLAYQPLSVGIEPQDLGAFSIQRTSCRIAVRARHDGRPAQLASGGSDIAIEFQGDSHEDLIAAARRGLALIEDFLSAISVVSGVTFANSELIQVACTGGHRADSCEFLIFKELPLNHWAPPITGANIATARDLLAHWDGLTDGHRLRRAALQYREAIGNRDDSSAFQEAYIGLETMEPPLARMANLTPGTEEVKGACDACGVEFTRKRTTLVGVRAFVLAELDPKCAEAGRTADWKLINGLRNDLMHGLADSTKVGRRAHGGLLACMAHLHHAICTASHAHELVTDKFHLARGGPTYVLSGIYAAATWPILENWGPLILTGQFSWVQHERFGFVPQLALISNGLSDLQMAVMKLAEPLSFATIDSLRHVNIERD